MPPDLENLVERLSSLTVIEAAELAKMLEEKWGVSAAAPQVQQAATPVEEKPPEQSEFEVLLTGFGEKKVTVVREVRRITNLGLSEAMALVNSIEQGPKAIKSGVSKAEAEQIKDEIEKVGGTVQIQ